MRELISSDLKKIEYEMLTEITDFCDQNSIRYFLACGTALGAVRHNGFIPWDDDVDIALPRPDYERFVDSYRSDRYEVIDSRFDKAYPYAFAKVSDKSTMLIENLAKPFPMGVYIDVFPIDGMPDDENERKRHLNRIDWDMRLLSWKRISKSRKVGAVHKLYQVIAKVMLAPFSISYFVKKLDKDVQHYSYEKSDHAGHLVTKAIWGKDAKPKELFEKAVKHKFETGEFYIPEDFDKYLTLEYGDYMKLPPKEKQFTRHDFVAYWKE